MAWSFRKRIKIAPGVHMNVGKNGPSFSVGGKGMSVTYGKNGTYLNSSIPGTGLRNRQKIGEKKTNTANISEQLNDNTMSEKGGCVESLLFVLTTLIFLGILTYVFFHDALWGIGLFVLYLLGLFISFKILGKENGEQEYLSGNDSISAEQPFLNADDNAIQNTSAETLSFNSSLGISNKDFDKILQSVMSIVDFTNRLCGSKNEDDTQHPSELKIVRDLILLTTELYEGKLTSERKESIGVFLFITYRCNQQVTFNNYDEAKKRIPSFDGIFNAVYEEGKDAYPLKLQKTDSSNYARTNYIILLMNYCSILTAIYPCSIEKKNACIQYLTNAYSENIKEIINSEKIEYLREIEDAARLVIQNQVGATSLLQRYLCIGYNRAGRVMDQLEIFGFVGSYSGSKPRIVYVQDVSVLDSLSPELNKIPLYLAEKNKDNNDIVHKDNSSVQEDEESIQDNKPLSFRKLDALIGLDSVKEEVKKLASFIIIKQKRELQGLKSSPISYHCVFTGNPGTGKTTVARIVASIYKKLGILKKGHLVETDRSGLVAEYVGQTAVKTNKIIDSALDGVLFIDEAYSLATGGEHDFGREAISTLLKRMEDDRERLVVILAGYTDDMKMFIDTNPGLQSRFNRYIEFPDYSEEELFQIFEKNCKQYDYKITPDAKTKLKEYLAVAVKQKDKNFGNARFVRNLFEKTIERQANRLATDTDLTDKELTEICSTDIPM